MLGFLHSLASVAVITAVFFAFCFTAYEPYRAMYPDMVETEEVAGRAQSTQAVARGLGTGTALLAGGLLLSIARALPFVAYLIANALWETALSALKAFVILYLTIGLGYQLSTAALIIGGVALVILVGAGGAGKLGDRFGRLRIVAIALLVYGAGFMVPIFTTSRPVLAAAMPFIALGGGAVMTMAYAVLMPLMPEDEHGLMTGFYSVSRGLGIVTGPILAGWPFR